MTSILTNPAAMAALQTLRMIDKNLEETQNRVSSGYRVETAADNAAYWSISTTMRSDNKALSSVQDALGLGAAKVDTAYEALESAIEVVNEIKKKLVAAYGVDADRPKIQEEIDQLQEQLESIAESASFSGENWLQDAISTGGGSVNEVPVVKSVVASFIRDSAGNISVATVDYTLSSETVLFDTAGAKLGILDSEVRFVKPGEALVSLEETTGSTPPAKLSTGYIVSALTGSEVAALGGYTLDGTGMYVNGTDGYFKVGADKWVAVTQTSPTPSTTGGTVTPAVTTGSPWYYVTGSIVADDRNLGISVTTMDITKLSEVTAKMTAAGLSGGTPYIDEDALDVMLAFVDKKLEALTSAASGLGSIQSRIDMQENFVSTLMDVIDKGVGRLVDADMNEESTRLKALQTQQQLGIQSLSIANSNAENILQLFQ